MNKALKIAIIEAETTQVEVAKRAGIAAPLFSKIVHEYEDATPDQKKAIAKILRCKVEDIFPSVAA